MFIGYILFAIRCLLSTTSNACFFVSGDTTYFSEKQI